MSFKQLSQGKIFVSTNETLNKDSVTEAIPLRSSHIILTEVQFSDRTEAFRNKTKKVKRNFTFRYHQ